MSTEFVSEGLFHARQEHTGWGTTPNYKTVFTPVKMPTRCEIAEAIAKVYWPDVDYDLRTIYFPDADAVLELISNKIGDNHADE